MEEAAARSEGEDELVAHGVRHRLRPRLRQNGALMQHVAYHLWALDHPFEAVFLATLGFWVARILVAATGLTKED